MKKTKGVPFYETPCIILKLSYVTCSSTILATGVQNFDHPVLAISVRRRKSHDKKIAKDRIIDRVRLVEDDHCLMRNSVDSIQQSLKL